METKVCTKCGEAKLLTEANFYPARPRAGHKKQGWQSYCKSCWKIVNKDNKLKLASHKVRNAVV